MSARYLHMPGGRPSRAADLGGKTGLRKPLVGTDSRSARPDSVITRGSFPCDSRCCRGETHHSGMTRGPSHRELSHLESQMQGCPTVRRRHHRRPRFDTSVPAIVRRRCSPSARRRHFDHQLQERVERVAVRLDNAVEVTLGHGRLLTISVRRRKCRVGAVTPSGAM
jgi:hypothetical protein